MDLEFIKILIQYGVLGVIAYFYITNNNANTNAMTVEYKKLIDNLIKTQEKTLKELTKAIDDLSEYIKSK